MTFASDVSKLLRLTPSEDRQHVVIRSAGGGGNPAEYSFGIEEEYFLADRRSFEVAIHTPNELFESANWSTGGQAMREMLQSQLEVATNVHVDVNDAREELRFLRREVANVAAQYGFVIMASGTHPSAVWRMSQPSPKPRYEEMIEDLRSIGHRNMMCGMHVHVQLPDPEKRMAVMRAMLPHLPLFIALSASSPFWNSHKTGLKGYRLAAYSELPRTGLPELFEGKQDFDAYVGALQRSGVIPDESHIWWAMRPSMKHPTLELRAPDTCTFVDDAIAIASLYRCLTRHLYLRPQLSREVTAVERAIAVENKWRAQRYGTDCIFASKDGPVTISELLTRLIDDIAEDAAALNCPAEIEHCRTIVERGSSAEFQLRAYRESGDDIAAVSQWIATSTLSGTSAPVQRSAPASS
ncbi:carboxylate-amine ligase [Bradyrhizobium sp. DASA03005]|uniref:carboxylate-amine ligase n=1 Tax=unclassified Bradyrhizobium TaxID=2631580 RepID=UPI003F709DAE